MTSPWSTNIMCFWIHFFWTDSVLRTLRTTSWSIPRPNMCHVGCWYISYTDPAIPTRPRVMFQSCNLASVAKSEHGNPRAPILSTLKIPLESWCCSFCFVTKHHPSLYIYIYMSLYVRCFSSIHRSSMKTYQNNMSDTSNHFKVRVKPLWPMNANDVKTDTSQINRIALFHPKRFPGSPFEFHQKTSLPTKPTRCRFFLLLFCSKGDLPKLPQVWKCFLGDLFSTTLLSPAPRLRLCP